MVRFGQVTATLRKDAHDRVMSAPNISDNITLFTASLGVMLLYGFIDLSPLFLPAK